MPIPEGWKQMNDPPGDKAWLDETRILPTSSHFVQVIFKVGSEAGNDTYCKHFYSNHPDYNSILTLPRAYIQSAEFDGVAIGARKGKISVIDPEGIWAKCFSFIGKWKNKLENVGQPNMIINFGWVGLHDDGSDTNMVQNIPALLLKTEFGMDSDGIVTIGLEFIENMEKLTNSIKFNTLNDLTLLNTQINTDLKNKKIYEILNYMCNDTNNDNEFTIAKQVSNYNLFLDFEETYEEKSVIKEGVDIVIRLGDTLDSKIKELIAKAMPSKNMMSGKGKEAKTYSYQMIEKEILKKDDKIGCYIKFGWESAPTSEALKAMNEAEKAKALGPQGFDPEPGPTLIWKTQSDNANNNEKSLVTFDLDLKMLDYATHMMKSELDSQLGGFSSDDWANVAEAVNNIAGTDQKELLSLGPKELANRVKAANANIDVKTEEAVGLEYNGKSGLFGWFKNKDDDRINESILQLNTILRDSSNNVDNQITTIIKNNVFKAKARIMGDPSFGTTYIQPKLTLTTSFKAVGMFASFFDRTWLLMRVSHKIEEGAYWTDIELMSQPPSDEVE